MGTQTARIVASLALFALLSVTSCSPVVLERLSQTYLPFKIRDDGSPVFCLGEAAAEQLAYNKQGKVVYVAGNKLVRTLDISDPEAPVLFQTVEVPGPVTDVAYCGGYLAIAVASDPESSPGSLFVYETNSTTGLAFKHEVTTGSLPDAVTFTPDCKKILTADEGEAGLDVDGKFINPEGTVTIVDLEALENGEEGVNKIDFKFVNKNPEKYIEQGVRWIWRGQTLEKKKKSQTFSKDLEPEQVVVTADGKQAFINMQENNAIAILDLTTMEITSIRGLGCKNYGAKNNGLDTSGIDGGPLLREWPGLFGLLQPDSIAFFNHEDEDYIVTANEGDTKEYTPEDQNVTEWSESVKGSELVQNTTGLPKVTVEGLADPMMLGNLKISTEDGIAEVNPDGSKTFKMLVSYGARSWSIFKSSDMSLVFDSGNDLERVMAEFFPFTFNSDDPDGYCAETGAPAAESDSSLEEPENSATFIPEDTLMDIIAGARMDLAAFNAAPDAEADGLEEPSNALTSQPNTTADSRSRSRGPEPEAVAVGYLGDRRLVFVGVERGNLIFVYDVSDPTKPIWQSAIYPGARGATWAELYNRKEIVDVDPEGIEFVSADDSPNGEPLLLVCGAVTGTVSVFRVAERDDVAQDCPAGTLLEDTPKSSMVISKATSC